MRCAVLVCGSKASFSGSLAAVFFTFSPHLVLADSWKRLAAPTHYAPTSAEVVQPSMSGGSAVVGTGTTTSGALTATATTMEADTPFFVEYPEMGTKCRVMAQSEAGLTLGNLFTIIDCNPTLKSALGEYNVSFIGMHVFDS